MMERERERAASIAALTSVPIAVQLIAGRAVRDTLFLTQYDASYLPGVMLAAAVLALLCAAWVGRLMPRWGPRATALGLTSVNGAMFILEGMFIDAAPGAVAAAAYLHISVLGAIGVSAFSSVVNERFDPLLAKSVVTRAGIGGALGGVLGGLLALGLSSVLEFASVLYGLGAISALVAAGVFAVGKSIQSRGATDQPVRSGLETLREDRHLSRIALTVMLLGVVGMLVDYAMKAEADARFLDAPSLLSFFSVFYMATSLLTFLTQATLSKKVLQKLGLGGAMAALPFAVALSAGLGALWTGLWTATLARGSQTVLSSSLFRSGYELLYTPIPPAKKRATKALVDIACNRIGYGLGSAVVMGIVFLASTAADAVPWVLGLATVVASFAVYMVRQLQEGYVQELATSLRDGSITLRSDEIVDATTLHTVAETAAFLDRDDLLRGIEAFAKGERDEAERRQATELMSDEPTRVLNVLLDASLSPRLAGPVIDLLGKDAFARAAYHALERMGSRITGQLTDMMLSPESPVAVRRRIPRLLRKIEDPRAVQGLVEGLGDDAAEVRYRCSRALVELQQANDAPGFPHAELMDAIARELVLDERPGADPLPLEEHDAEVPNEIDALLDPREDRSLRYIFELLSVTRDRDAIVLSLRALHSGDEHLRGTALEYLHNVLPEAIREALWPRLLERRATRPRRPKEEAQLMRSMRTLLIHRDPPEQ